MLFSHAPDGRASNPLAPVCETMPAPFPSPPRNGSRDKAVSPTWPAALCSLSRAEYDKSDIHRLQPADVFPRVQCPLWRGNFDIVLVDRLVW